MSDIKLFRLVGAKASEIKGSVSDLERPLQTLIEENLESILGIRFVATEHSTGRSHAGRIDTLGLDENHCPVIIEYKRSVGENVINQGLFYLNWLMDHRAEFKLLVLDRFGKDPADAIDWTSPRVICIAADFTKYDAHAVLQIDAGIELVRYRRFGSDLLLLELVNPASEGAKAPAPVREAKMAIAAAKDPKPRPRWLPKLSPELGAVYSAVKSYVESLGDDIQRKDLKLYVAFKRLKNFMTVVGYQKSVVLYLHLNPAKEVLVNGMMRDVSKLGHWGTGDLEIVLTNLSDLEKAKPLINRAYDETYI